PEPATVVVFAADHGVLAEGVSPWPQEVTAQMVANFSAGGAAINVVARQAGARVIVVDVGVAGPVDPAPGLIDRKVRPGTANLIREPAMSVTEARRALDVGAEMAADAVADGARCLLTGDMGIANTTPSAALISVFTGRPPAEVTGRGTGIDDATLARKVAVVEAGLARARTDGEDPVAVLASIGGLEIAALAGFVVGGAAARVPVVVDGVIALAGVLVAAALAPAVVSYCLAGHRSSEPGASAALAHLGLEPLLDLGLRLGEGTGACLALPLVQASARVLREMATFDAAGISDKS
ncbi:MAG: nicotinate-nucleotide--dimethylbenzimidazole phosphoribosyltransferase, partial [Actinomycetota bacterium]|nr:nicotinate-nucleotide--dimethylbenzimidazole phosphoribosyltransferase [Actinomycetota bacterium]